MESTISSVTLLIKGCPNRLLGEVVPAIESFGFDTGFLLTPLNVATDQSAPSAFKPDRVAKANKKIKGPLSHVEVESDECDHIIYMKSNGTPEAVEALRTIVDVNMNTLYGICMYCLEVRPRKYQTLFPLVFKHEEVPHEKDLRDLFSPFGKCTIRSKDEKTTYINYKSFEQVQAVLDAMENSQLKFQHMVVHQGLFPVQNSKLMILFDEIFNYDNHTIISNNCITRQQLTTWFSDVKKKASCEKTWEELVDFLGDRIWGRFGWTYNAEMEIFCSIQTENVDDRADGPSNTVIDVAEESVPEHSGAETTHGKDATSSNELDTGENLLAQQAHAPDIVVAPALEDIQDEEETTQCSAMVSNATNYTIFHEAAPWNQEMHPPHDNVEYTLADGEIIQDAPTAYAPPAYDNCCYILEKMNTIPLYGDELHPLHLKLCRLEQQLFNKSEPSNVGIHYRLTNMEIMMNTNGQNQPLAVRLTDLSYWIEQYLLCL